MVADTEELKLADLIGEAPSSDTPATLEGLAGFSVEDTAAAAIAVLDPAFGIAIDGSGETLGLRLAADPDTPLLLTESATAAADDEPARTGISHRRAVETGRAGIVLRFLDTARDYLPGSQHATGRMAARQPEVIELPAAIAPASARRIVETIARRRMAARERIVWRDCELDGRIAPGATVRLPTIAGVWRVERWEWRASGVELELSRLSGERPLDTSAPDPTDFPAPADATAPPTALVAFEMPPMLADETADRAVTVAALGSSGPQWSGAALFADHGDGLLRPLRASGRARSIVGATLSALPPASSLLVDREAQIDVQLVAVDQTLSDATLNELAQGANLALIGDEIVQFAAAAPLGGGAWRLSRWLRGRAGTEAAGAAHVPGEPFAMLGAPLVPLDGAALDEALAVTILAQGRGDEEAVASPLRLHGIARRPLAPVHGRARFGDDGTLYLGWVRRSRGSWRWRDGADVPLAEESERYLLTYERDGTIFRSWSSTESASEVSASTLAALSALATGGTIAVRQQGTYAASAPLVLTVLD